MEKFLKRTILDDLYEAKGEDFADNIGREISKQNKDFKSYLAEERLI